LFEGGREGVREEGREGGREGGRGKQREKRRERISWRPGIGARPLARTVVTRPLSAMKKTH